MILVSGSKRSGTSMWMQLLAAGGLPIIGERFPPSWEALVADANPDGFYESQLSAGIYYRTNPHPLTGAYLFPEQTRAHAVKVFAPGLLRSDVAFIDRVIVTIREWREHTASVLRLRALLPGAGVVDPSLLLPPVYEWWSDAFSLLRDVGTRRYPVHFVSYARLVGDPAREIAAVFDWLGAGDPKAALAAVRQRPRPAAVDPSDLPNELGAAHLETFDTLYDHIHRGVPLSPAFVRRLNETDSVLRPRLLAHNARLKEAAVERLLADADSRPPADGPAHER
jgi:hypothetical protein